jgi:hypothetical protein
MKIIPKFFMTIQIIMIPCDLSNVQKCNLKECPLTWVAPWIMILPLCGYCEITNPF